MKNWNLERYKSKIRDLDWTDLYSSHNVSKSYGIFEQKIRSVLDQEAPMRNIQLRSNFKSWVSIDTKKMDGEERHSKR